MATGFTLSGITFGRAWCAAGARNFSGEGWPHHRWLGPLAPDFRDSTFVAKTTTVEPREGNMPLSGTMPAQVRPPCIRVNARRAAVLNAVGLSGPGLDAILSSRAWQTRLGPFVVSFMAVDRDRDARLSKVTTFAKAMAARREEFLSPFAIEVNLSCPNVGLDPSGLISEGRAILDLVGGRLPGVPLIPKLNALVPPGAAAELGMHPGCAAICCSNTIPWGAMAGRIDWRGLFGETSPLARYGGGGLSGAPLTAIVGEWAGDYLDRPHAAPLVVGGGVMRPRDAIALLDAGASAVEIGSVAIVRPWRVRPIVRAIHEWGERHDRR